MGSSITGVKAYRFYYFKIAILFIAFLAFQRATGQLISTYSGQGVTGFSGDNGTARSATLNHPFGMAFDKGNNLYFCDNGNNVIRKIDVKTKIISSVVGALNPGGNNTPLNSVLLAAPRGIAFDKQGYLYISDAATCVRKVDFNSQTITTVAGIRGQSNLYGNVLGDGGIATEAFLEGAAGLAFDSAQNLYIADMDNSRIRRVDAVTGIITTYAGGGYMGTGDGILATDAELNQPLNMVFDKKGNLYISDQGTSRIRKVDAVTHIITTVAGKFIGRTFTGDGGPATEATIDTPIGIAIDGNENLYIADCFNNRIRKIDHQTGIITTIAGSGIEGYGGDCGPAINAALDWPWDVVIDANQQVYFSEFHNATLRKLIEAKPNVIAGADKVCLNDSVVLTNTAVGGVWQSSDNNIAFISQDGIVKGLSNGTAMVSYRVDNEGCSSSSSIHAINVNPVTEANAILSSKSLCTGDVVNLKGSQNGGAWTIDNTGVAEVSNDTLKGLSAGKAELKYLVFSSCAVTNKLSIQVSRPQYLFIGNDTSICKNAPLAIDAGNGFVTYRWSTGDTTQTISVNNAGSYSVTASDVNGCSISDAIGIKHAYDSPIIQWSQTTVLCKGSTVLLTTPLGNNSIVWQDNSTEPTYTVRQPGKYWVSVTDNHQCKSSDTLVIQNVVSSPGSFLPNDTAICSYEALLLRPSGAYKEYQWSTGETTPAIQVNKVGLFILQVKDAHQCLWKDSIEVRGKVCQQAIYFPSAFTPNNDGRNDVFKPKIEGPMAYFKLCVLNRWGVKIFETSDSTKGWDGKRFDAPQDQGTYIWTCIYQLMGDVQRNAKGTVVLLQ